MKNVVQEEEGKELADKNGIGFFQTSAQTKLGINELFIYAIDLYIEKWGVHDLQMEKVVKKGKKKEKDECCGGNKKKKKESKMKDDDEEDDNALNVQ